MVETMLVWAKAPDTQWWILAIAVVALMAEAVRSSREVLWGDLFDEDIEDDY